MHGPKGRGFTKISRASARYETVSAMPYNKNEIHDLNLTVNVRKKHFPQIHLVKDRSSFVVNPAAFKYRVYL